MTAITHLSLVDTHSIPATEAISLRNLDAWFADSHVLRHINLDFRKNQINCIIGPSGSGKSTLIRSINRINDDTGNYHATGEIIWQQGNILASDVDLANLRTQIGMVFQKPCVFPKSIAENVLFGIQHLKTLSRQEKAEILEENLKAAALWKEISHRLDDMAGFLSLGQQQRLCIARTLAVKPKVIMLDEPTSSLDPAATRAIEDLLLALKEHYTIIFVTHNIQQARRIADQLIFICNGEIIESGTKERLFSSPEKELTQKYLNEEYCDC